MGWRVNDAYDRQREEDWRAWLDTLTAGQRLRVRLTQAIPFAVVLMLALLVIAANFR